PRTKAGIIHDLIRANIKANIEDNSFTKVGDFNRVFGINVNSEFFIRFKKMDRNFNVSSFLTRQHNAYMNQGMIEGFPKEPTFLFAGYIPNPTWTSLEGVYLACWNNGVLEWYDEEGKYSYKQFSMDFEPKVQNIQSF